MATKTRVVVCDKHHWMLPAPGGPTSIGTCKHCGAVIHIDTEGEWG